MNSEFPANWKQVKLEDVAKWGSGGTPSRKNPDYFNGNIPWIKTGELGRKYISETEEQISEEAVENSSAKIFPKGSVAIAMYGATIGKTSILKIDASSNQACAIAQAQNGVLFNEFLYYFLLSQRRQFVEQGKGGAQPNISQTLLKAFPFLLPPLPEQHRIVAKIEALFTQLDKGVEQLTAIQKQLKIYRQSVLKAAFEGKLTEAWRKVHQPPPAETLLAQIKAERQQQYEKALKNWKEAVKAWGATGQIGKKPAKPSAPKEYAPLTEAELGELPDLPEGWMWIQFNEIFQVFVGATPSRKKMAYWNGNIPWVSSGEVAFQDIRSTKEQITQLGLDNSSTTVHPIGTVMLAMIGEGKTRGQAAILRIDAAHNQNTAAIRVPQQFFSSKLLFYYLMGNYEKTRRSGSGNNQKALNKNRIENFHYPFCSLVEQHQIVQEIESRLSVCDQLEKAIAASLQQAEALRQSILKKAFEGRLVPQNPDDPPAGELLERIRRAKDEQ